MYTCVNELMKHNSTEWTQNPYCVRAEKERFFVCFSPVKLKPLGKSLKRLMEGEVINVIDLISSGRAAFSGGGWTGQQVRVVYHTLSELERKGKGIPPFQNTLNKLFHFFTGYYKEPVGGFNDLKFERVDALECSPLVGETSSKTLRIPSACLTNITTFENMINKAVVPEAS